MTKISFNRVTVGDTKVFFREAGDRSKDTLLLLHGFPSSSNMFRNLLPLLCDRFHLVAPDLPGFGFTVSPDRGLFNYTFDGLTDVIEGFTNAMGLCRYALYLFDYGAPVGFRLAMRQPERVHAIISQNGNAYAEGLSAAWAPLRSYWDNPSEENREALRGLLSIESIHWQYSHGTPDPDQVAPEAYWLDYALTQRSGNDEIQLDLFRSYASNVALYPRIQQYLSERRPPLLAVWGKNDPFFLPVGAEAFRRDVPEAQIRLLDTGHFALETHADEIARLTETFLNEL